MKRPGWITVLALTACLSTALAVAPRSLATDRAPEAPTLRPCPWIEGAECGGIEVALDRRYPELGTTHVGFIRYPHRRDDLPSFGTIVAVEGGPGYSSIASRWWYKHLYNPLLGRRDLLLIDLRGTGRSDPVDCPELQSYRGPWKQLVKRCGRDLGPLAERYGSAFAAADLVVLLDALGIERIDLYGDSYGTFFGQTFAIRYPERVRTLTLDAAYPVAGEDAWWRDTNRAIAVAFRAVCERDPVCAATAPDPMATIGRLAERLRRGAIVGDAADADGRIRSIRGNIDALIGLVVSAATNPTIYRELQAAARSALRGARPDPAPLLRLMAESAWHWGAGNIHTYSEGLAQATGCNDYPQLWDITAPLDERPAQYAQARAALGQSDPEAFAPFGVNEWTNSSSVLYTSCIRWPSPTEHVPAKPVDAPYPGMPTLVLDGDLDSLTSPEGAQTVASTFTNATYVEVANMTHVSALGDLLDCTSAIVLRFVRTQDPGDTSCAAGYPPVRTVPRFPIFAAGVHGSSTAKRAGIVAAATAADVMARWWNMGGTSGVGLRGGSFQTHGYRAPRFHLAATRWVEDVAVTGDVSWDRRSGRVVAILELSGSGIPTSTLRVRWNTVHPLRPAVVIGFVGGSAVQLHVPTP